MIFSVSNDGIEWSLDFGPDSVTLTVTVLVQEMTMSSQVIPLAAWSMLLSQRQQFLNDLLARVPVTPNPQGTHEMKDEVLSSVGARDMDTSGYQVSSADLDDVEFLWEKDQLDVDAVFRPALILPFHQQRLTTWRGRRFSRKPHSARRRGRQRELPSSNNNNHSMREQHDPCIAEKSPNSNKKRKCSCLCLYKIVSIGITVYVF